MAKKIIKAASAQRSGAEIVHEALDSIRESLAHVLDDKAHNVLETIKYAASKIIKKSEKDLNPKALKKAAKHAIRKAAEALHLEAAPKTEAPAKKATSSRSRKSPARKAAPRKAPQRKSSAEKKSPVRRKR